MKKILSPEAPLDPTDQAQISVRVKRAHIPERAYKKAQNIIGPIHTSMASE
jgi:hypothetical protein